MRPSTTTIAVRMPRKAPDQGAAAVATSSGTRSPGVRVYTIGHSTRDWAEFVALLNRHGIVHLVDVRTMPGSRRYPHFDREAMMPALAAAGIEYEHAPALGGRRRARPGAPKTGWRNASFAGYADHMSTPEFGTAIASLIRTAAEQPTTIMCSEAVHWRCHRALVADALVGLGVDVQHIMDAGLRPHSLTPFARIVDGEIRYDADDPQLVLLDEAGREAR